MARVIKPLKSKEINRLIRLAKTCSSRQEFQSKYPLEWKKGRRFRIHTKMFSHLKMKKRKYWSDFDLLLEAKKYNTRSEFSEKSGTAYNLCLRRHLKEPFLHMNYQRNKWNNNYLRDLNIKIKSCSSYREFCLKYPTDYSYIMKLKKEKELLKYLKKTKVVFSSVGEETLRNIFNKIFGVKFCKSYPTWLINNKTGRQMELDGYNENLKIAFEHNGRYHESKEMKFKDKLKIKLCEANGVKLIVFSDISSFYLKDKEIINKIKSEFLNKNIKVLSNLDDLKIKWVFPDNKSKYSKASIIKESKKYKTLKDFVNLSYGHYLKAISMGIINEVKKNLKYRKHLSNSEFLELVLKHKNLNEFKNKNKKGYKNLERRKKLLNAVKRAFLNKI